MADEMQGDRTIRVPEHVLSRRVAGETVLLNLDNEEYYGLDEVGSRFWELVEAGTTFESAVDVLLDEYEVDRDVLVGDLTKIVSDLAGNGLVLIDGS